MHISSKINLPRLLALFAMATGVGSNLSHAQVNKDNYGLLWKIEGNGLTKPSYLFGTMHVKDKRAFEFSDSMVEKFMACEVLALELDLDTVYKEIFNQQFQKGVDQAFQNMIFDEEEEELIEESIEKKGFDLKRLRNKHPRTIDYLIDDPSIPESEQMPVFLDAFLYYKAKEYEKPRIGLERFEDQISMFDKIDPDTIKQIIFHKLDTTRDRSHKESMVEIYQSGDLDKIETFYVGKFPGFDMYFLDQRNVKMVAGLDTLMPKHGLFIGVGVAHLPGKMGIINLLREKGYTVTKMPATFSGGSSELIDDPINIPWKSYVDSAKGFSVETPFEITSFDNLIMGVDMKACIDLLSNKGYYFFGIPITVAGLDAKADDLYDKLIARFEEGGKKISKKKNITYNGVKGIQFEMQESEMINTLLRVFIVNSHVYFFMTGSPKDVEARDDKFFNSVRFFEPSALQVSNVSWKETSDELGAFSIEMPSNPLYKKMDTQMPGTDMSFSQHLYMAQNVAKQQLFLVIWNDLPGTHYYDNDSVVFTSLFGEMLEREVDFSELESKSVDGIPGYELKELIHQDGVSIRTQAYLRGGRTYLLMAQTEIGKEHDPESNQFFNSIRFLPYHLSEYSLYAADEISVRLPEKLSLSESSEGGYWNDYENSSVYISTDKYSGVNYTLNIETFDKYFMLESIDSLFSEKLEVYEAIYGENTTFTSYDTLENGIRFIRSELDLENSNLHLQFQYAFANNSSYELYCLYKPDSAYQRTIEQVFNSITIEIDPDAPDAFAPKKQLLLNDLREADSASTEKMRASLSRITFDSTDLSMLHDALFYSYADSARNYFSVKTSLIDAIEEINDPSSIDVLKSYYTQYYSDVTAPLVLKTLTELSKDGEMVFDLLMQSQPSEPSQYLMHTVFRRLIESEATRKALFENRAIICNRNIESMLALTTAYSQFMDSVDCSPGFRAEIAGGMLPWFLYVKDTLELGEYDAFYRDEMLAEIVRIFGKVSGNEYDPYCAKLEPEEQSRLEEAVFFYKLMKDQKVSDKKLTAFLNRTSSPYTFLRSVSNGGKISTLPSKYHESQALAKYALLEEFKYDEDYAPEFISAPQFMELEVGNKTYECFVFEFSYDKTSPEKYLALVTSRVPVSENRLPEYYYIDFAYDEMSTTKQKMDATNVLIENLRTNILSTY